jgi:hypothetical protein
MILCFFDFFFLLPVSSLEAELSLLDMETVELLLLLLSSELDLALSLLSELLRCFFCFFCFLLFLCSSCSSSRRFLFFFFSFSGFALLEDFFFFVAGSAVAPEAVLRGIL